MIQPIYKPIGLTPLQALEEYRRTNPKLSRSKITYAGRLDPMAEGVLILLIDEDQETRQRVLAWGKTYEFEMLVGAATDTYDVLGVVKELAGGEGIKEAIGRIEEVKDRYVGRLEQAYPPYSAKVVEGKPLWQWAREGKLAEITIPRHELVIEYLEITGRRRIGRQELLKQVEREVGRVEGDFRQGQIVDSWRKSLTGKLDWSGEIVSMKTGCSSGMYVRQLVYDLGNEIGVPALARRIVRTRVGWYTLEKAVRIDR